MNIRYEKKGMAIDSLKAWKELGNPKKDNQWKEGRSARLMAELAIERKPEFAKLVSDLLAECGIAEQDFVCEPEAATGLGKGMGRGGSRKHDLLMRGNDCVIGIEAKVSEIFDEEIGKRLKSNEGNKKSNEGNKKSKESNKSTRAQSLIECLIPEKNQDKVMGIGYQLFTATRGTMCAASKHGMEKCIMLVITFKGNVEKKPNYDANCAKNAKDFDDFLKATGADGNGLIVKDISGKDISCWIKHIDVTV